MWTISTGVSSYMGREDPCKRRPLWLDESLERVATSATCLCAVRAKTRRALYEATEFSNHPLGTCRGERPWLGRDSREDCNLPARLLIRTAANAYFPQVVSVLSLPDRGTAVQTTVKALWEDLQIVG